MESVVVPMKMTRGSLTKTIIGCFLSLALVSTAIAASVHFKRRPVFDDLGQTLNVMFSLAGLGNGDVTITVAATGSGDITLISPGGNAAPGQNKVPISAVATTTIPSNKIKNGNVFVSLTTGVPPTPTPAEAGAPNDQWNVVLGDVTFSSATITVVQGGVIVLQQTFTFAP